MTYQYPYLVAEFTEAVLTAANLKATLTHYNGQQRPPGVDLWSQTMARYIQAILYLSLCPIAHPEWADELNNLLYFAATPAQKVFVIEQFLELKGERLDEGVAMVVPK